MSKAIQYALRFGRTSQQHLSRRSFTDVAQNQPTAWQESLFRRFDGLGINKSSALRREYLGSATELQRAAAHDRFDQEDPSQELRHARLAKAHLALMVRSSGDDLVTLEGLRESAINVGTGLSAHHLRVCLAGFNQRNEQGLPPKGTAQYEFAVDVINRRVQLLATERDYVAPGFFNLSPYSQATGAQRSFTEPNFNPDLYGPLEIEQSLLVSFSDVVRALSDLHNDVRLTELDLSKGKETTGVSL